MRFGGALVRRSDNTCAECQFNRVGGSKLEPVTFEIRLPTEAPDLLLAPGASAVSPRPAHSGWSILWRYVLPLFGGVLAGAFGTAIHRSIYLTGLVDAGWWHGLPVGLLVALALVASASLLVRAIGGLGSLLAFGAGLVLAVQVLSLAAPGGSVLILDPGSPVRLPALGVIWAYGGAALLIAALVLPRRWFISDERERDNAQLEALLSNGLPPNDRSQQETVGR